MNRDGETAPPPRPARDGATRMADRAEADREEAEQRLPRVARPPVADWLLGYVAHAPRAVAVVAGPAYRVCATNAEFRRLATCAADATASATDPALDGACVGRPVAEVCAPTGAAPLLALLDRVRRTGGPAQALVPGGSEGGGDDPWHCTAWDPADVHSPEGREGAGAIAGAGEHGHGAGVDAAAGTGALVVELWAATDAERAGTRQRDVTERALLGALREQQLAEAADQARAGAERREAELAAVLESIPDAVYLGTHNGISRANQPALSQLGVATLEDLNAWRAGAVLDPAPHVYDAESGARLAAEDRPFARALAGATVFGDVLLRAPDGTAADRTVRCAAAPVVVDDRVVAAVLITSDVTAQRRLEAQLRHAHKLEAVGRLAGGIAHDFSNLLTVIGGNAETAALALPAGSPVRIDLREITDAAGRAAALTRQLLAFSRQQVLRPTALDLTAVVVDVERLLSRVLGDQIALTSRLDALGATVVADRAQVEQVLMNLAVNARDAMPGGGTLEITTARVDRLPSLVAPAATTDRDVAPRRRSRARWCDPARCRSARRIRLGRADDARHGSRNGRGDAGADLRALLHDEGGRLRDRPRARHRVWHRRAVGRPHRRGDGPGRGDRGDDLFAGRGSRRSRDRRGAAARGLEPRGRDRPPRR